MRLVSRSGVVLTDDIEIRGASTSVWRPAALTGALRIRNGSHHRAVVRVDGRDLPPELDGFDRALVDAPCSGLGVLASRPDLRWRAEPLPELQLALLRSALSRVRSGGTVVYSTCTINREENEDVVDAVLDDGAVEIDASLGDEWPVFRHRSRPELLQTLPHVHGTSGFFVARLRRT